MAYLILAQGENVSIVTDQGAEEFSPLVMHGTQLYDASADFKILNGKAGAAKSLPHELRDEALFLIDRAKEEWTPAEKEKPRRAARRAAEEKPKPMTLLESMMAEVMAKVAVDDVVALAKPIIDQYVGEHIGTIPKVLKVESPAGTHEIVGVTHEKFEAVLKLVHADVPVFLTGPAGSGKNMLCQQVATALGAEFYFSNAVTQEFKLTGFIDANGHYHETQFYKAFTGGGVFMLDEIDASTPEVLVVLNAAIANRYFDFPTGRVDAHENFRLVAAGNTYGTGADIEYTGRYQLDAASLDRFAIIEIDYSPAIEEALVAGDTELLSFVRGFREAVRSAKIRFVVSYRALDRMRKLKGLFSEVEAISIALTRGLERDDIKLLAGKMPDTSSPYVRALKQLAA